MDGHNPYQSSTAPVMQVHKRLEADIPDTITSPIRNGWITACVSCALTLILTVVSMTSVSDSSEPVFSAWNFVDVALIAALAFGIYKRSRTAATIMFVYFVLSKILIMLDTGLPTGLILGLVFATFYFRAMTATYRYHRLLKEWQRNPPAPRKSLADSPAFNRSGPDAGAS
ncbi:hypothetical protein [Stenotrophomonas sp. Iso1]|uniref:hypothetical protein n=1 Tax=Stenotrophomonas sp. Iso1 TaxID=2977283 RepID=UPI0022B7B560|nr:hypothetical protein [Stenotrophomonas sp. Iso1]